MTSWKLAFALAAISLLLAFAVAAAQEPVRSFDQLNTRLKLGDSVRVTDLQGREINGRILDLGPTALTLDRSGAIQADAIGLIAEHAGRPVGKGALWGLAAGAVFGAVAVLASGEDEGGWYAVAAGYFGAIGAGTGAIVGALIPGKTLVVYRAPAAGAGRSGRLSVAPIVTPRAKGAAVSFAF